MKNIKIVFSCLSLIFFMNCAAQTNVDLVVYNAKIYTVDPNFSVAEAMAIKGDRIVAIGSTNNIRANFSTKNQLDARGKFIYPGFIDAHSHFFRYSLNLQMVDLVGTGSWDDVVSAVKQFAFQKKINPGEWIIGRGWDQNDWEIKDFPSKEKLDQFFPNSPVILTRIDGHAAIVNQKALDIAGVRAGHTLIGGSVETKNDRLTGMLIDNAVALVSAKIPAATRQQVTTALVHGQANCFGVGLTTVDDCGLDYHEALLMDSLQKNGTLKMRIYAMLSDAKMNYEWLFKKGKVKTSRMNIRSFKVYADGALGSRGACLLQPYEDRKDWSGFLLSSPDHFDSVANIINAHGFQMCTHAIGDSGNRTILNIYAKYLRGKNDKRWRIEHAQVVNQNDFNLFGQYSIIPSVQPTHATSDMYWAEKRLGPERVKDAYAYKELMDQNNWIPLGTDFPVEDISPFKTFYAAVFRVDAKGFPAGGYQFENALSRQDAIRGMTIWAAMSNFEEKEKGSLEKGKLADFVIIDRDLLSASAGEVLTTRVLATFVGGEQVFPKK